MTQATLFSLKTMESLQNRVTTHFRATSLLPSATKLRQGNVFTPGCHSVHRGVSASVHAGIHTPLEEAPTHQKHTPRTDNPPRQTPPPQAFPSPLKHPPAHAFSRHPRLGRHTPQADTPPPPADGYCSERYAYYWNAFLFSMRTVWLASSQSRRSFEVDVWCKRALTLPQSYKLLLTAKQRF